MMKWTFTIVVVIALLAVLCVVIGALRPRGHVASSRASFKASRQDIWAALSDFPSWPKWNSAIIEMRPGSPEEGKPVWVAKGKWGEMPSVIDVSEPPLRLVTRIPEGAGLGFSGSWTYELVEDPGGGTLITITERGEVRNPFFRFMMIFGDNRTTQVQFMKELGRHLGEEVEPIPATANQ